MGEALLIGKVPALWLTASFPSLKPLGPYIREVLERCEFFSRWVADGAPVNFWLSAFFFTQAFLTGAKQNYARKHKIAIDGIDFDFATIDAKCRSRPADGVFVHGAHSLGALAQPPAHTRC